MKEQACHSHILISSLPLLTLLFCAPQAFFHTHLSHCAIPDAVLAPQSLTCVGLLETNS